MAATPPYLPQELVDTIIDYIHNDRSTLASCALVSRSWLHSSRYHLFATISLAPHANTPAQRLCARLYQLLQDSPSIILYIRQLHILEGLPPHQHSGQWVISERTLPPLLKLLKHLKSLEISATSGILQWKSLPFTLQNAICAVLKLPSLAYFRLYSWTFPNLPSLTSVLSLCQHLKGLSLSSVIVCDDLDNHNHHSDLSLSTTIMIPPHSLLGPQVVGTAGFETGPGNNEGGSSSSSSEDGGGDENTMTTRVAIPRLEVLTLDNVNFGCLGYLVLAPAQSPSLINFRNLRELRIARSADPFIVEQILVSIGPSLEHLHLKPGSWEGKFHNTSPVPPNPQQRSLSLPYPVYPFDLRNNINLKSLRLTLEEAETALNWCTTFLSSLSSSSLLDAAAQSTSSRSILLNEEQPTPLRLRQISFEFWTDLKRLAAPLATSSVSSSPNHVPLSLSPATPPPSASPPPHPTSPNSQTTAAHTLALTPEPHTQPTWSSLDSLLSHLPSPLKEVNIGLFAQSSHPDFIRVKEALSGIHARMYPDDLTAGTEGGGDDGAGVLCDETILSGSVREECGGGGGGGGCGGYGYSAGGGKNGIVRVYQLGLKSQRSFGRICGPRLRSFEGFV